MKVGIDLDNTIINYDGVFYSAALDLGWITPEIGRDKESVKSFLIEHINEDKWTELQGIVYGKQIYKACPYDGVSHCFDVFIERGYSLHLVSHKTRYPIIGEKVDFHIAAKNWLTENQLTHFFQSLSFCETKALKIETIDHLNLDCFIDDLPSILLNENMPSQTKKFLFDPMLKHLSNSNYMVLSSWQEIAKTICPSSKQEQQSG
jgi:hypothetical protein